MEVTGYKLQHTVRELTHRRDIAASQFSESLYKFEGDSTPSPTFFMEIYLDCEQKIARLQTAQQRYNLAVEVDVDGNKMTLSEAIKRVGGAGRAEKMWRSCASDKGRDRYHTREITRSKDEIRAERQVSVGTAMELARTAAKFASALRTAIQVGNATTLEVEGLEPSLFE